MYDVGTRRMRKHPGYTYISYISYTQLSLKYGAGHGMGGGGELSYVHIVLKAMKSKYICGLLGIGLSHD
jgi:hypothetical protein